MTLLPFAPLRGLFASFALAALVYSAQAGAEVALVQWTPDPAGPTFLLPAKKGESPDSAVARYLAAVNADPVLRAIIPEARRDSQGALAVEAGAAARFQFDSRKLSAVALANNFHDQFATSKRMTSVVGQLEKNEARAIVVPVAAETALESESDRAEFRELVASGADLLLALGGRDIDPSWYGGDPALANMPNLSVDRPEMKLIETYLKRGKGVFVGICRGAQACATIAGHDLLPDIEQATGSKAHLEGTHSMDLSPGASLLKEMTGFNSRFKVNTSHHQSVLPKSGSPLQVIATSDANGTKIVEALQTANRRVLLMQFHPERMGGTLGPSIMSGIVKRAAEWKQERGADCSGPIAALGAKVSSVLKGRNLRP